MSMQAQKSLIQHHFNVTVVVDKNAAMLAGCDEYGPRLYRVNPSELSEDQRLTLVNLKYQITGSDVNHKIIGTESLLDLLAEAAEHQKQVQHEFIKLQSLAICEYIIKIEAAPLADKLTVDMKTGAVDVEKVPDALVSIHKGTLAVTNWEPNSSLWQGLGFGYGEQAISIRDAVFKHPAVDKKIKLAFQKAECLQRKLDAAETLRREFFERCQQEAAQDALLSQAALKKQLELCVLTHPSFGEVGIRRFMAGLMPDSEVINVIEYEAFRILEEQHKLINFFRITDDQVIEYFTQLGISLKNPKLINYAVRPLTACTNEEFETYERIKKLFPTTTEVTLHQHYAYPAQLPGNQDPEYRCNTVKVTQSIGQLTLSSEYLLGETHV